jgi:NTP pyrophosphatase (non-canonical NTP hydrolase)
MKEDLLKIINHYGVNKQLKYIHTEYFELDEAITIFENTDFGKWEDKKYMFTKDIEEEIADVMVMLKQIQYHYKIKDEAIEETMKLKIERQLKRIEEENE